jgi:type IV secretory pathway TraG/TraD family ATPase VirD4
MPSNLIATVTSKLAAWPSLPDPDHHARIFSIRDFVDRRDDDAWLFLSTTEDQRALLKPLLSLWSDIAATAILTLDKAQESKIWFVLDEVASLQKLPALPGLLERGRKHGCAVLLGLQAMPQLEDAYGTKLARAIASQPQTWLVLRSVEPETARFLESALGQTEYLEPETSYSMGAHAQRDGVSLQERIATRPVALASEISSLPDLSGFLKLPGGHEVFRVSFPFRQRPIAAPGFVERRSC